MKISIANRIKRAMIGFTLLLCLVFTALNMLMVYVIEDQVFINLLKHEKQQFEQVDPKQQVNWQPGSKMMKLYTDLDTVPVDIAMVLGDKVGVYEYFNQGKAGFVLLAEYGTEQLPYVITFDVSEFLAVRSGRLDLWTVVGVVSLVLLLFSIWVASRLAKKTLSPLRKLTAEFQDENADLPQHFAIDFAGDEVGVLAQQLERSIMLANSAAEREFEFNQGVSHELRTPIQIAQNSLELLSINSQLPLAEQPQILLRLDRALKQMHQITEAFLWMASQRNPQSQTCDGSVIFKNLIASYQESYPNRSFEVKLTDGLVYMSPPAVLKIIVDNLLRNAIQHSSSGTIYCQFDNEMIRIENDTAAHEQNPGFGIGLNIVARLCEQLNWRLSIDATAKQKFQVQVNTQSSQNL